MFHFPAFPPHSLYIQLQVIRHDTVRGFPIRKSWSQRPVIDSTRLIADSHVLHRLLMPRHPPCALKNFNTNQSLRLSNKTINKITKQPHKNTPKGLPAWSSYKMLAFTIQFPNNNPTPPHHRPKNPKGPQKTSAQRHRTNTETPNPHPQKDRTLVASKPNSMPNHTNHLAPTPSFQHPQRDAY